MGHMIDPVSPSTMGSLSDHETLEEAKITVKEKWQGAVNEGSGFVAVPMSLLRLQSKYQLNPTDMLVLINLLAHWWDPKKPVFPRSTTIAKRMGVDLRTVQRATHKMVKAGLIERDKLTDGKRVFAFDNLAKRLAADMPLAFVAQAQETFGS
ncbi:helix-turn-helix domain-containing protein [Sphingomonas zeae]|jgi:predicted transcriptional regulator|uniref:Helix-turn-helix domain-containing protein n=2 Tax=Sphingomonadaceae TaxID=41297 RepID=A0A7Y6B6C2_9SPHN|nr:helix-turn-helix domain-containing protein [Sphingomonas zeae]NUU47341.1 helix-turn-helix domain-containing protein [Sphingomonas zeae]